MGYYSLTTSVNNACSNVTDSYITNGFVKNPIIAGMVVSFTTIVVLYLSKTENLTKLFIMASLINITYLFFHTHAIKSYIGGKAQSANLKTEFDNIATVGALGGSKEEEFKPPA